MSRLSRDYIITNNPDLGLLERYGYTTQDFKDWMSGKPIQQKELKAVNVREETRKELDDFFS